MPNGMNAWGIQGVLMPLYHHQQRQWFIEPHNNILHAAQERELYYAFGCGYNQRPSTVSLVNSSVEAASWLGSLPWFRCSHDI